jgi:hypothetical protein
MERLEELLGELKEDVRRLNERVSPGKPMALTMKMAAHELSVGLSTLQGMVRKKAIETCVIGGRRMVPMSEIYRITQPARMPSHTGGRKSTGQKPRDPRGEAFRLKELRKKRHRKSAR